MENSRKDGIFSESCRRRGGNMQIRKKLIQLSMPLCCVLACCAVTAQEPAFADWETTLKSNFDIVETFDNDQDFTGKSFNGISGDVHKDYPSANLNAMPVKSDGTPTIWNYYSMWSSAQTAQKWVAAHGTDSTGPNQIGTKSLVLDLFNLQGPSRMGSYFGKGTADSGYQDIYVFYRVKIPSAEWPTSNVNNGSGYVSSYTPSNPYAYFYSWKFFNVGTGFVSSALWENANGCNSGSSVLRNNPLYVDGAGNCRYGDTENLVHIVRGPNQKVIPELAVWFSAYLKWSSLATDFPTGGWAGVEMRYKLETPAGTGKNGVMQMWVYDVNGNATQVLDLNDVNYRLQGNDSHYFNRIVIGGNNSNSFSLGSGMVSQYYVDDVIINGGRVGPTYYRLLSGASSTPPGAPKGITGTRTN
jgi:hypothetical protein